MVNQFNIEEDSSINGNFNPTDEQSAILRHEGNCVIAAGPGSGKTTILSHKIKQILERGKIYQGIAAISFTNKASSELASKTYKLCKNTKHSFFGTIDSFYISNIIIPFGKRYFGFPSEHLVVTKTPLTDETRHEVENISQAVTSLIQRYEHVSLEELSQQTISPILELEEEHMIFLKERYQAGFLDLRLVPGIANLIFLSSSVCRRYISSRYTHLLIDEFQDSGYEQYQLFKRIADAGVISWAVGDQNQFLYRFLERSPMYLRELFNHPNFTTLPMSENHRSHPSINCYAQRLLGYEIEIPEENKVFYHFVEGNEVDIGRWFNENIDLIKQTFGIENNVEIGILARKDITLGLFMQGLEVPYKFYRKTPLDEDHTPTGKTLYHLLCMSFDQKQSVTSFVENQFGADSLRNFGFIRQLKKMIQEFKRLVQAYQEGEHQDIEGIEGTFRQISEYLHPNAESLEQTIQNIQEIFSNPRNLEGFIPAKKDEIQLMNIHKSKGLEFDFVLHLDLYQTIIPSGGWVIQGNDEELMDSLNLHYVAVTRAKKGIILVSSSRRFQTSSGEFIRAHVSEFITEEHLEIWES
ncbi:UvrD-helicase domain-containing protein [Bacillus cereus]|uniref:UvrD-helicase domain-containing protein n=1 Tax=Bacillus cereus TaxID=1396 RepID=UPI0011A51F5B|nr:ATP-dependent helicase [Bacillus cereus]